MSEGEIRETGISVIGNVSCGTHLYQFYQSKEDLLDILLPYFKAGLENNEFCMWVTLPPPHCPRGKRINEKGNAFIGGYQND